MRGRSREDMPGGFRGNTWAPEGVAAVVEVDGCVAMSSDLKDAIDWRCCSVLLALCNAEEKDGFDVVSLGMLLLDCTDSGRGRGGAGSSEDAVARLRNSTVEVLCRRRRGAGWAGD